MSTCGLSLQNQLFTNYNYMYVDILPYPTQTPPTPSQFSWGENSARVTEINSSTLYKLEQGGVVQ